MKSVIRIFSLCVVATFLMGASIACNTTEGVGRDVESAGDGLKDAARDAKN